MNKKVIAATAGAVVALVTWQQFAAASRAQRRPPGVPAYAAPMNIRAPELDREGFSFERSQASGTIAVESQSHDK
jgi:hypothetical protein